MADSEKASEETHDIQRQPDVSLESRPPQPVMEADVSLVSTKPNRNLKKHSPSQQTNGISTACSTADVSSWRRSRSDRSLAENCKPFSSERKCRRQESGSNQIWLEPRRAFNARKIQFGRTTSANDFDSDYQSMLSAKSVLAIHSASNVKRSWMKHGFNDRSRKSGRTTPAEKVDRDHESVLSMINVSSSDAKAGWRNSQKPSTKFAVTRNIFKNEMLQSAKTIERAAAFESLLTKSRCYLQYLTELASKPTVKIWSEIRQPKSMFETLLQTEKLETNCLFLLVKVISTVCLSDFAEYRNELLNRVCGSFLLRNVSTYLGDVGSETDEQIIGNLGLFVYDLTELYLSVVSTLPMVAFENDFKLLILKTKTAVKVADAQYNLNIDEKVTAQLTSMIDRLTKYETLVEKTLPAKSDRSCRKNFRDLSLYPTYEDLHRKSFGFVRPNLVKGSYQNAEHYLDVQFRLLREDFIDPLRKGLKQYTKSKLTSNVGSRIQSRYEGVRMYAPVKIEPIVMTRFKTGFLVIFDEDRKLMNVNWETSKQFMHGSLLIFTIDDFETFFYATVVSRDTNQLKAGKVLVRLVSDMAVEKDLFARRFLMAESEVFFEPYYQVLNTLKTFKNSNFPMSKYIIRGECETENPRYLFEFKTWNMLGHRVQPSGGEQWPSAGNLGLDDYQYAALKKALTANFCIIQGPPGTGKTFLGLKIVEVLLESMWLNEFSSPSALEKYKKAIQPAHEEQVEQVGSVKSPPAFRKMWKLRGCRKRTPILVVCFTNHALDQFLEGIIPLTKNMIRIGSQSKSEMLEVFNLRNVRKYSYGEIGINDYSEYVREQLATTIKMKDILDGRTGIMNFSILREVISSESRAYLQDDDGLLDWLLEIDHNTVGESKKENISYQFGSSKAIANAPLEENLSDRHYDESGTCVNEDDEDVFLTPNDEDEILPRDFQRTFTIGFPDIPERFVERVYCLTVAELRTTCMLYIKHIDKLNGITDFSAVDHATVFFQKCQLWENFRVMLAKLRLLVDQLRFPRTDIMDDEKCELLSTKDIRSLGVEERWILYWYWIKQLRLNVTVRLNSLLAEHQSFISQYVECRQMRDSSLLGAVDVVGMTTTSAARLQCMLRSLKPAVVIVEEAAEVLESHIVASLTKWCQHVIMIGDHKQLRPSAAAYKLAKDYHIDVSLFERMINNGMDCPVLNKQHRMRPEISCLISPLIYPDLENHELVLAYESIRGVEKNVFFLEHNIYEQNVEDSSSKTNEFEADFMLLFCRYLVKQGYNPAIITMLTTYSGQVLLLRRKKRRDHLLKDVKCVVIDEYQGEENEIILLSLVRSNHESRIGFLKIENRVCVALSRAKKALYMIGNMDNLSQSSPIWTEIKKTLEKLNSIGREIKLYCDKHDVYTGISSLKDFDRVPEGGCNNICSMKMKCGHTCGLVCHIKDHDEIICRQPCSKTCRRLHPCELCCGESCGICSVSEKRTLVCGHSFELPCHIDEFNYPCPTLVDDVSPVCLHPIKRQCCQKPEDVVCSGPCEDHLECGHSCPLKCHKTKGPAHRLFKCEKPCKKLYEQCSRGHICARLCYEKCGTCPVPVEIQLACGHVATIPCSVDASKITCDKPCEKICSDCNQRCRERCGHNCGMCTYEVKKTIPECGHVVRLACYMKPERNHCTAMCSLNAPCGHKCRAICSERCGLKKCVELVRTNELQSLCGHDHINVVCHKREMVKSADAETFLQYCDEPCNVVLKCGDVCSGTCGQCWQGRLHKSCQKKCKKTLVCGHRCTFPCGQICPPCNQECNYRCKHTKCSKRCGIPCAPCKEICGLGCKHSVCSQKCSQICDRKPCDKPCEEKLGCGHSCVGFCGEPCPPLCIKGCNPDMKKIVFGWTNESANARFVLLEDCGHIIESRKLDAHLKTSRRKEIVMKACPQCKTPITVTSRYKNHVLTAYAHIFNVKKKMFGCDVLLSRIRVELAKKVRKFHCSSLEMFPVIGQMQISKILTDYENVLEVHKRMDNLVSNTQLSTIEYICDVFSHMIRRIHDVRPVFVEHPYLVQRPEVLYSIRPNYLVIAQKILKTSLSLIQKVADIRMQVNEQQSEDIGLEMQRFYKMVDFYLILRRWWYTPENSHVENAVCIHDKINELLFGCGKFTLVMSEDISCLLRDLQQQLKIRPLIMRRNSRFGEPVNLMFRGGGQNTGRWFICSAGHYYCTTEFDSVLKSNCSECGRGVSVTQ